MATLANIAVEGERDGTYYWDSVKFLVEGISFKVPRYHFVIGSTYFAERLVSTKAGDSEGEEARVTLEGVTASQFRTFLKLLFPIHTTSTTLEFSKEEWLVILELSTLWDFHEFRKLAKEHLEPQLDDPIERIVVGRAAYIPRWVLEGYETLVTRSECISEQESERIGHLTAVRLYILRHERCFEPGSIASRFHEEIHALEQTERDHMSTNEKRREEKRLEEEKQRLRGEEEQRVKEEIRRVKEAEAERRLQEKEKRRKVAEAEGAAEAKRSQEEEAAKAPKKKARKKKDLEEQERREREIEAKAKAEREGMERKEKEANERIRKREEELRMEEARIAKELADSQKRKEEERIRWERSFAVPSAPSLIEIAKLTTGLLPPFSRNSPQPSSRG